MDVNYNIVLTRTYRWIHLDLEKVVVNIKSHYGRLDMSDFHFCFCFCFSFVSLY